MRAADVVVFYLPCISRAAHENKEEHKKSEHFVL